MNNEQFENLREEFLSKEAQLLEFKGREYGADFDRLLNFKEISALTNMKSVDVCLLYMLKHIQSLVLAIKSRNYQSKWYWSNTYGNEGLKQRIADARNYLLLLAACIEEEVNTDKNENIN